MAHPRANRIAAAVYDPLEDEHRTMVPMTTPITLGGRCKARTEHTGEGGT